MHSVVKKWANSAAVRIPAAVLTAAQLDLNQQVNDTPILFPDVEPRVSTM